MKNKILILGGTSYLGSNLFYLLNKKYEVYLTRNVNNKKNYKKSIYLKNKKKIIDLNLNKNVELNNFNFSLIINCIGNTKNYNNKNYNLKISNSLLKKNLSLLDKLKFKILLHISSSMIYGYGTSKFKENKRCKPITKYGKFKYKEEKLLSKISNDNKKIIFLRLFSIFGKENKTNSIFDIINKKKKIVFKNPNHRFDLISLNYLSQIIKKIILYKRKIKNNEIINCCSGKGITPIELIKHSNKNNKIINSLKKNKTQQIGCNKKLISLLSMNKFNLVKEIKKIN
jgi:nucleoside-diphosphate-sugar epimerase